MAEYGLQIRGAHGFVQIDSNYFNLALVDSFTVTANARYGSVSKVEFEVAGETPMLALHGATDSMLAGRVSIASGRWRYTVVTYGSIGTVIEVHVFDRPGPRKSSYGLEFRDSTARITFSSDYRYMRVVDFWTLSTLDLSSDQLSTRSYAGGRKYAFLMATPGFRVQTDYLGGGSQQGATNQFYRALLANVSAASVSVRMRNLDYLTYPGVPRQNLNTNNRMSMLVLDIT